MQTKAIPARAIEKQIQDMENKCMELDADIQEAHLRIAEIRQQQRFLQELMKQAVVIEGPVPEEKPQSFASAVVAYVQDHPGTDRDRVLKALSEAFPVGDEKDRRSKMNGIWSLIKRGKLRKDDQDKLYAVNGSRG